MTTPTIVLVGAGRIGTHLAQRLKGKGLPVAQVISRTAAHARALAELLRTDWSDDWSEIRQDADWVILAVRDDAIEPVARLLAPYVAETLVTHTSGATPGAVLAPYFERFGVFYPLQSFSPTRMPIWSKIPFCVDAQREADLAFLKKVAKVIGNLVYQVNDEQRAVLHVAAVFANNFANHCFAIAEKILEDTDLPFDMLHPLMEETLAKALQESPARMQTGPAVRGDVDTILRHVEQLKPYPELRDLYLNLSKNINPALALPRGTKPKKS
ncbi:MAG: DUF2520 domain-containing protein [Saprospiraceae bacterium]|nr:DUF2520 domain-containing protein [Saprospiraceae bacterium]